MSGCIKFRGKKVISTVYIHESILKRAKEIGLNISKICDNALNEAIARMEGTQISQQKNQNY